MHSLPSTTQVICPGPFPIDGVLQSTQRYMGLCRAENRVGRRSGWEYLLDSRSRTEPGGRKPRPPRCEALTSAQVLGSAQHTPRMYPVPVTPSSGPSFLAPALAPPGQRPGPECGKPVCCHLVEAEGLPPPSSRALGPPGQLPLLDHANPRYHSTLKRLEQPDLVLLQGSTV